MVRFWSWLRRMSTQGMMQLNSFRKKLKISSSSSITSHPASPILVGSNSPDGVKTLDDVTFVLKHRVQDMDMNVPSYRACSWESVCCHSISTLVLLGDIEKNPENPAGSERNLLTNGMWDVTCCMMKAEDEERWIFQKLKSKRPERA